MLFVEEICLDFEGYECGVVIELGVVVVDIGIFIGCLLKDKFIVKDDIICDMLWWMLDKVKNDNKLIN